jgi:hypothetical protein
MGFAKISDRERTGLLRGWLPFRSQDGIDVQHAPKPSIRHYFPHPSLPKLTVQPVFVLKPREMNFDASPSAHTERREFTSHIEQKLLEAAFTDTSIQTAM